MAMAMAMAILTKEEEEEYMQWAASPTEAPFPECAASYGAQCSKFARGLPRWAVQYRRGGRAGLRI